MITVDEFIRQRRSDWERLAQMTRQVQGHGFRSLPANDLEQYSRLYRRATGDLARAQTRYHDPDLMLYLNQLVGQAHGQIYVAPAYGPRQILRFFLFGFPRAVRENRRPILLAIAISLLAAIIGFLAVWINPEVNGPAIIPGVFLQGVEDRIKNSGGKAPVGLPLDLSEVIGSFIMYNNIKVGFIAFAIGVFWGMPTVWVLVQNGLMLGGLSAVFHKYHAGVGFWSLILPHGVIELSAIFICGGAGFLLGQAMIAPGDYLRKDALVLAARKAARLVVGCVPLFVVAAIIESKITPLPVDPLFKLGFALVTAIGLISYLSLREPEEAERRGQTHSLS